ncbi:MAG TPA: hypothetical protein VJY37_00905 [Anaerovoracaceae bacterium]|nr:hypothetical protein [Anaerovoracaceae bacterium]
MTVLMLTLALVLTNLVFTGCGNDIKDLPQRIEEKVSAYETDIMDSLGTLDNNDSIRTYLYNWAKSKDISVSYDYSNNVIMSIKSDKDHKDADPVVVQCSYDEKNMANCVQTMAVALYLAKNPENHGSLKVIFTAESGHDFAGIEGLSSEYFTNKTKVFCLSPTLSKIVSSNSGASAKYTFSHDVDRVSPKNSMAYKIRIKGLTGGIPDKKISSYPNPIKALGDLLAYFKTNSIIFELASFSGGGSSYNVFPKSATMTIVINENDKEKFTKRMDNVIEKFNDNNLESQPDLAYTYEEVDVPDTVLSSDDCNQFVSLLYTTLDGVYYKDDDGNIISITNVGSIEQKNGRYYMHIMADSLDDTNLDEISNSFKTICSLCDATYKLDDRSEGWSANTETDFFTSFAESYRLATGDDVEYKDSVAPTANSYIKAKNPKTESVYLGVTEKNRFDITEAIIKYMGRS